SKSATRPASTSSTWRRARLSGKRRPRRRRGTAKPGRRPSVPRSTPESDAMSENLVRYEDPAPGVARIVLSRVDKHNSLNPALIFAINEAFDRALRDDAVKVIVLAADGRNFSAGHDIADTVEQYQQAMQDGSPGVSTWSGFLEPGAHGWYASE